MAGCALVSCYDWGCSLITDAALDIEETAGCVLPIIQQLVLSLSSCDLAPSKYEILACIVFTEILQLRATRAGGENFFAWASRLQVATQVSKNGIGDGS